MVKWCRLAILINTLLYCFWVQADSNKTARHEFTIGVLYWSMNIPGQVAMRKGLEQQAETINQSALVNNTATIKLIPMVAGDGERGIENQIVQMRELIRQKVDIIIVQPTDNAALVAPLKEANQANIPVVAYDQYISGGRLSSYLTSNNYMAGYYDGEYIASKFTNDKVIKLILVEYPHVSSTVERVDGFLDALKDQQQAFRILNSYEAVEPVGGRQAGQQILRDFPQFNSIDVIFTVNDGGGLSVVDELARAGRKEVIIATIDGDPKSVQNIRQGRLTHIDSAQFCGPLGAQSMQIAYDLLHGKKVPKHILIPVFPITRETLIRYPGWLGPIPEPFEKPWPSKNKLWDNRSIQSQN